jgi:type II secretory pathway pseudopilin PulG
MPFRFKSRSSERGYVLLVLLLFVAMLSIGFFAAVRQLDFQVKRDREEEMIHRGVQYSRAIKAFYKKFGRYPTRIEDLENTNGMRFLRRRYKDPLNRDKATGQEKDFKLLHLTDIQSSFGPAQRGMVAAADLANQQAGAPGALTSGPGGFGGRGPSSIAATSQQNNQNAAQSGDQQAADQNGAANRDQSASPDSNQAAPPPPQPLSQQVGSNGAPQVFGGGAVVGVASFSKEKSIREFNKKNHYNQWQFIYDPTMDRGGLLMTPNQPPLQGASQNLQQDNQNGNQNQPGFGSSGFGSSGLGTGMGQSVNPSSPQPSPEQPSPQQNEQ